MKSIIYRLAEDIPPETKIEWIQLLPGDGKELLLSAKSIEKAESKPLDLRVVGYLPQSGGAEYGSLAAIEHSEPQAAFGIVDDPHLRLYRSPGEISTAAVHDNIVPLRRSVIFAGEI